MSEEIKVVEQELSELLQVRRDKLKALQAALADSKIQPNMTGTFDLQLDDSRIFFRQNVR